MDLYTDSNLFVLVKFAPAFVHFLQRRKLTFLRFLLFNLQEQQLHEVKSEHKQTILIVISNQNLPPWL